MKTAAIIQARMGSHRLPGKVLKKLCGHSVLWHIMRRISCSLSVNEVIVATSVDPQDDRIVEECRKIGVPVFRGDEEDVLDRFYQASKRIGAELICRITADNPLVEPGFIDMAVARMTFSQEDYLGINGCPMGTGIELFTKEFLEYCAENAIDSYHREHVTPFMKEHSGRFVSQSLQAPDAVAFPDLRLTLDTEADLEFFEVIYNCLYSETAIIALHDVIQLVIEKRDVLYRKTDEQYKKIQIGV